MKRVIRLATRGLYAHAVKPVLFRFRPDGVHGTTVKLAKTVQRVPLLRDMPRIWQYKNDAMLSQTIAGIEFKNPIGLSAGFDKEIALPRTMRALGFGWMTGGSVTWGSYKGNDGPWFHRLPKTKALVVNAGLPSEGTQVVAERVNGYSKTLITNFPLSVSVAKTNTKDCADDATAIKDYCQSLVVFDDLPQVKLLEINISCPNTFGGEPFTDAKRLEKLLKAVDSLHLNKPVFIKMPISLPVHEFDALLAVIAEHTATGVTIGNLHKDRDNVDIKDPLPNEVKGGLSGAPTSELSTAHIRRTYQKYGDKLVIIGVGGIFSVDDAYEKIRAGASLVALITGMIFEGPQLIGTINQGLAARLKHDNYTNISQAIGTKK